MDQQFYERTNEILRRNAANNLIDYKGSGKCKNTPQKACIGKVGTVDRRNRLKRLNTVNSNLIKLRKNSGSKTMKKAPVRKVAKKAPAKKVAVKKATVAVKKATVAEKKAKVAVKKATVAKKKATVAKKRATVAKKAVVKKAPAKKVVKRKKAVKGSGFSGGCADCPHCGGAL